MATFSVQEDPIRDSVIWLTLKSPRDHRRNYAFDYDDRILLAESVLPDEYMVVEKCLLDQLEKIRTAAEEVLEECDVAHLDRLKKVIDGFE